MTTYPEKSIPISDPSALGYAFRIAMPAGIAGGILLIVYFLILMSSGLHKQTDLRWINFILIIPGAVYSINKYINNARSKTYLKALVVSLASCVTAYLILSVFMIIFLTLDSQFMNYLHQEALPQLQLTQLSVFVLLMFEGLVGGVIISFVALQYFKDRIDDVA